VVADATLLTSTLVRLRLQASRPPAAVPHCSNGRQFAAVVRSSVDAATSKDDLPETFVSGLSNGGNAPQVGRLEDRYQVLKAVIRSKPGDDRGGLKLWPNAFSTK
jgi:hypothetical protein